MRSLRLLVVLLVVAGVLLWFWRDAARGVAPRSENATGFEPAPAQRAPSAPPFVAPAEMPVTSARSAREEAAEVAPVPEVAEVWRVHGVVRGSDGVPLAQAQVWTWSVEGVVDEDGRYELVLPRLGRQQSLFASAPGQAERETSFTFPAGARELELELVLGPAFQVRGRVLDEHGRGLAGATVTSFYSRKSTAVSGADGEFLLDHLDPGRGEHLVYARREGFVQAEARVATQGLLVEGLELVLTRGTPLSGRVLAPDGTPLAGVALYVGDSPFAYDRLEAESDASGAFLFPNVGAGPRTLVAQHAGFAATMLELALPAQAPGLAPLVLTLQVAHWIGGTVRDAAGTPLAGVSVAAKHAGEYLELDDVQTDAEGKFRLEGLPDEDVGLEFYATGLVRAELALERLDHDTLAVTLARAAQVGGLVRDAATSAPVPRFRVRFVEPELGPGEQRVGGSSAQWWREGRAYTSAEGTWTSTDEEFEEGQVIGAEVSAEGYAPARLTHVVARAALDPRENVFELAPGGRVRGQVLDADGLAVAGAKVYRGLAGVAQRPGDEDQYRSEFRACDDGGRFEFTDVPTGSTELHVFHDALPSAVDGPFLVLAGGEVLRTIVLARGAVLEGLSLTPGGTPLGGVPLRLTALDATGRPFGLPRTRRAEADGSFRFTGLAAGDYRLMRLFAGDETPFSELQQRVRLEPEGTTRVTLRAAGHGVFEGRLVLTTGRLPAHLLVRAVRPPGTEGDDAELAHGALALDGLFRFEGLAPGRWDLHATIFGDDSQRDATLAVELAEGERRTVELVFRE